MILNSLLFSQHKVLAELNYSYLDFCFFKAVLYGLA